MIKRLKLRFGKAPTLPGEEFDCTPITVFVGPNNSGKSKILQEIHGYCTSGQHNSTEVILDNLEFETLTQNVAEQRIAAVRQQPGLNETMHPGHIFIGKRSVRHQVPNDRLLSCLQNPNSDPNPFCAWYLSLHTMILDGKSRIGLVQSQGAGDLQQGPPSSSFQQLFRDDSKRIELRRIIHEAFERYLVIDPTNLGALRLRLSDVPPSSLIVERGIHEEAVSFHAAAQLIDHFSDGVKAFTGMMSEIIAGSPEVLLIDEPEAFLHPSLASLLGREISRATLGSQQRLFVSTHSPNFVMGCVQSGVPITIVRLTYRDGVATARTLVSSDILRLMRNPLLRSIGVLSGLFYESVIVTESDADRAFYQEINERLLLTSPERGIRNCLFLNAQNRQTVPIIMQPLRQLGIATAGIVDIDVIKDGGAVWTRAMDGAFLPELERQSAAVMRGASNAAFESTGRDMKREGGVSLLNGPDREAVENLFNRLAEYGLFVVPNGELESWLKSLDATGHGPEWLIQMFERMGEDPENATYIHPGTDDVWAFMGKIRNWFANPARRGIPI